MRDVALRLGVLFVWEAWTFFAGGYIAGKGLSYVFFLCGTAFLVIAPSLFFFCPRFSSCIDVSPVLMSRVLCVFWLEPSLSLGVLAPWHRICGFRGLHGAASAFLATSPLPVKGIRRVRMLEQRYDVRRTADCGCYACRWASCRGVFLHVRGA